jgi:hypothetical protein
MNVGDRVALSANIAGSSLGLKWRGTVLSVATIGIRVQWDGYNSHYYHLDELVPADRVHMEDLYEHR